MIGPPPPRKQTRTYRIGERDFRLIEIVAASAGMKPSSFVREAALEVARRELVGQNAPSQ
jgi:uncharacterized protein (DUF1778 family)